MVKTTTNATLRFAGMIRVSTEQQAQTGESLRTQRAQIEDATLICFNRLRQVTGGL
jgi:hypothetical protein